MDNTSPSVYSHVSCSRGELVELRLYDVNKCHRSKTNLSNTTAALGANKILYAQLARALWSRDLQVALYKA